MAIGFSGSSGGIAETYRKFAVADVEAGIKKYESLYSQIQETLKKTESKTEKNRDLKLIGIKYSKIISDLKELDSRLKEQKLEEVIRKH